MDGTRFDSLTRSLAHSPTRRRLLHSMGLGLAAGAAHVVAPVGVVTAAATCRSVGAICRTPGECCSGVCGAKDATGRRRCRTGCPDALLSGGPDPTDTGYVDDDLEVFVNGVPVFVDNDERVNVLSPIPLGPVANGDVVRLVASNTTDSTFCPSENEVLFPIYLHCPSTGASQVLNPNEIVNPNGPCGHVFYDESHTVAL